jgi:hypothetical protein
MRSRPLPLTVLLLVALGVPLACGKKDQWPGPVAVSASGSFGAPSASESPVWGGVPAASSDPNATASAPTSAPIATGPATATASASASASAATTAVVVDLADAAAEQGLKALAAKAAPGMEPDGAPIKADLKEGDHAVAIVTLQPGRCYTIVGHSPSGGVKDLDVRLLAPPFFTISAGEDKTTDNNPVVGRAPNPLCPALPLPLAYKIDVFAKKGAGRAIVQMYSKFK